MAKKNKPEADQVALEMLHLRKEGMQVGQIAEYFGVHRTTVWKGIKRAVALLESLGQSPESDYRLGEAVSQLERLYSQAMERYAMAEPNTQAQAGFLRLALDARNKLTDLFQATGVIKKLPEGLKDVPQEFPWDDDEIRAEWLKLALKARKKMLETNGQTKLIPLLPAGT